MISEVPWQVVAAALNQATRDAAMRAVEAGREVAGWEDGQLVMYNKTTLSLAAEAWRAENAQAFKAWNEYVEKHGLPLAKYRMF